MTHFLETLSYVAHDGNYAAYYDRLGPYLSMLEVDTTLRARAVTVYEGGGALLHLARSKNERERVLYDRFVQALSAKDFPAVR